MDATRLLTIQIPQTVSSITPLPMRGTNPNGVEIAANSRYLTLAGKPWLPVMGEFHYSRYPAEAWENELRKMKAGGITIAATYIFWIHNEEVEGQFDWSGDRDLRRFIELCSGVGLYAYPRIGPWAHGECRNGGFPDWLVQACGNEIRQDAPTYLSYVRRFFGEISRQLSGLLWKDGGPVIGIQIENELRDNAAHLLTLKGIARDVGLDVPLYTMTGWGPAEIPAGQELIPVFGGYPDAFWDRHTDGWSRPARKHYFFSHLRDDNTIGADLQQRPGMGDPARLEEFPYGTCETGGGMQVSYHRRPLISPEDVAAAALVKVGSGSNLQGYYMYHGGANPIGKHSTMQESQETGYPNDLPVINYDFQAPLGQYGQARPAYHALRPLHLFLQDFGARLAPMPATLPEITPASLDDRATLRWAVRSDGERGFLFINNCQRIEGLPDHPGAQFEVTLADETLTLPAAAVTIPSGMVSIWPLNFDLDGLLLKYATAQPLCRLDTPDGPCWVFFTQAGMPAELAFDASSIASVEGPARRVVEAGLLRVEDLHPGPGCLLSVTSREGQTANILLLGEAEACQVYKANLWGQERIFLSTDSLLFGGEALRIQTLRSGTLHIAVYPDAGRLSMKDGAILARSEYGVFTRYSIEVPAHEIPVEAVCKQKAGPAREVPIGPAGVAQAPGNDDFASAETWQVTLPSDAFDRGNEIFLSIEYTGDAARAYIAGELVDDDFYHTRAAWEIGLRHFTPDVLRHGLTLQFLPLRKDAPVYIDSRALPDFNGEEAILRVVRIRLEPLYEVIITLP